jgi:aminocarboxymuconate-semialdehyde decarboxylase
VSAQYGAAVDVHAHYVPREMVRVDHRFAVKADAVWGEALYFDDAYLGPMPARLTELSLLLEDMAATGVSQRLCCTASWMTFYGADAGLGRAVARANNEQLAAAVAAHPGRLLGLAATPLQDVDSAVAELVHAVERLGLSGVAVGTSVNGDYYDHPRFRPFFAAVEELAVPVFFHPDDVAGGERLDDFYLGRLIGNPHEATLSLARIILGGVLEQFPGLKLCFPMGGGSIAYLLGRIRHGWEVRPEAKVQAPKSPDEYLRQCYFDTVLHSQEAFDFLVSVVPPEQLVMGSDYSWDMGLEYPRQAIEASAAITAEQKRGVLSGNIERLLGNGTADNFSTDGTAVQRSQAL